MINITAETDQNDFSNVELRLIKPINKDTVHKICSGQVVLSLAVAVKELVENALDAGATNIEVRFKNYGIDLIEVIDNGSGVADNNFAALALKYHTSKLNEYSDLLGVTSFGFRGEALSSLCALSNLTVTTKHKTSEYATRIEYDHEGNITKKTPCSRQVGTTVSLSNLFHSLPVRQKEFHKNVKREFNKMTQLLYAYCLISLGVKITSNNVTNSNSKSIVVSTQGSLSYKDNIASVFGVKQLNTLLKIKPEYEPCIRDNILKGLSGEIKEIDDTIDIKDVEIDLSEESNDAENSETSSSQNSFSQKSQGHLNYSCPVEFTGYISSCAHGSGRSSTDRQFYYVNSRPCEPTKVIKLVNEIYRQYNPHQYPFVFLNLNLERTCVDVNVTPDKRQIFLTKEKIILDVLKSSLLKLFECIPRTLKVESTSNSKNSNVRDNQASMLTSFLQKFGNASKLNNSNNDSSQNITKGDLKRKTTTLLDFVSTKQKKICNNNNDTKETSIEIKLEDNKVNETADDCSFIDLDNENIEVQNKHYLYLEGADNIPETQIRNVEDIVVEKSHTIYCKPKKKNKCINEERPEKKPRIITDKEDLGKHDRKFIVMKTSVEHVTSLCNLYNTQKDKTAPNKIKFKSEINPVYNKKCEDELSREISSDSFKRMTIIGQFNLGFIITQLEDDLFIIDQHASDEIYNFETLQKTTELTSQKLVIPQQLDLTGVNEQVLMDHLDIFRKNGFTFTINEQAMPTKRVKLLTIPMSRNWIFGKEDIEELLFMLRESPSEYCRPSRVRAMFASRACRKSVMIGTALSKTDMRTLVNHMADIDKPWVSMKIYCSYKVGRMKYLPH